ncbi:MAG TPA: zinc-binding dehydrogenase [Anaerolineales bacterium]|nr:zinc-binding dehydrogenase [Anaerolineales bacterium]
MRAVMFHEHGGPETLIYSEIETPSPGPGEVLVRLHAAALNRLDLWVRQGWAGLKLQYPHIPGADGAGEVAAIGPGVEGWSTDEWVVINSNLSCGTCEACLAGLDNRCTKWELLGETRRGTYAEYVVVPAKNLLRVPQDFSLQAAAAASLAYHTAWHSLIIRGALQPGETVLIVGAAGGVNTACLQIARLAGAVTYVVGSDARKLEFAASLGADYLIDRSKEANWARTIFQLTNRRGVDVVVDNVGTTFPLSFRAARKGGRILTVGNTGGAVFEIDNRYIFSKHLSLLGSTMGTQHDFLRVMELIYNGRLRVPVDRVYPLSEARQAQEYLAAGEQLGKVVLDILG